MPKNNNRNKKKVDFFLIGAPRSATTTIAENLAKLDSIFIPAEKEPHFFCFDFHREGYKFHRRRTFFRHLSWRSYKNIYRKASDNQILGDCSTSYIYSEEAAEQIYKYNPKAKIIAIIREPVSLMYSWYNYLKYYNEETAENFTEALNLESKRKKGNEIPKLVKFPTRLYYSKVADYDANLRRYSRFFPKKNLLFILYDDFADDPKKILNQILCFVGSTEKITKPITSRNQQKDFRYRPIKKFFDNLLVKLPLRRLPESIKNPTSRVSHLLFDTLRTNKKIEAKDKKLLKQKYYTKVERLSSIIGRDLLSIWLYKKP